MGYSKTFEPMSLNSSGAILGSSDLLRGLPVGAYSKVKWFTVITDLGATNYLTMSFDYKCDAGQTTFWKLYINGVYSGHGGSDGGTGAFITVTLPYTWVVPKMGDTFEIWAYCTNATGSLQNFRILAVASPVTPNE